MPRRDAFLFPQPPNLPEFFLFMHRLHKTRFYSLVKHYQVNGLSLRTHGNKKRLPNSAFSAASIEPVVKFIMNVTEDKALLLPGRVPGFKRIDVKLLPSSMTKSRLWKSYQGACAANGHESVGYSKFYDCGANFAFSLLWWDQRPISAGHPRRTRTKL